MPTVRVNGVELYYEDTLLMRRWIPHAGLVVFPACGHTPNLEEPALFNAHVAEFLAAVEAGRWAGWVARERP